MRTGCVAGVYSGSIPMTWEPGGCRRFVDGRTQVPSRTHKDQKYGKKCLHLGLKWLVIQLNEC